MTIHASIVQEKSDPLSAMIGNGLMKESTTGFAILDDVDVDVFGGFANTYTLADIRHLFAPRMTLGKTIRKTAQLENQGSRGFCI